MARILVTGSTTGLGRIAAAELLAAGHGVILHARNASRNDELRRDLRGHYHVVVGDIRTVDGAHSVAAQANALGAVDAVIHNAGIVGGDERRPTVDGVPEVFAVNVLAPYILTASIPSSRHIFLSSDMHQVSPDVDDPFWERRRWQASAAYSESKFYVTALAFAVADRWPNTRVNAVDPGWVPTRMGGGCAPDDLAMGASTQVRLAADVDGRWSERSGCYFRHFREREPAARTRDGRLHSALIGWCETLAGIALVAR